MNIAIISDFNIGGQLTYLTRAINKYTKHKARCIIAHDDSFAYDKDIILRNQAGFNMEACKEAVAWVKQCDFFHFGRGIFNFPGIDWNKDKLLNKNNCCIKYYGSELRNGWQVLKPFHEKTGIAAITGTGWSITGRMLNSFYHLGSYFTRFGDMKPEDIPICKLQKEGEPFKIVASSAGHPSKGYDVLAQTIAELKAEGVLVELEIMQGMSNQEVLKRKLECQATFTSLHAGWGISGVESMFLGHIIFSCLDPWVMSFYPENPTVLINKDNLKEKIREIMKAILAGLLTGSLRSGVDGRNFAIQNFNTKTILKKYLYIIDLIMHSKQYMEGGKNPEEIYNF